MDAALQQFSPVIGAWFDRAMGIPTPPQKMGWPLIAAGKNTLILAPTGSGKTFAAFLAAIDAVAKRMLDEPDIDHGVQILYLSPLKSLANDVQKNLIAPLRGIADLAADRGEPWPEIDVGLRTGDTTAAARAALLRHPPAILITTPESLNLLLTSSGRRMLSTVRYVIVDEIHAMAGTKRGVFLSLLLERLEQERLLASEGSDVPGQRKIAPGVYVPTHPPEPLVRIGLSATARPIDRIAAFLVGFDHAGQARPMEVVNGGQRKRLDLQVICPWNIEDEREGEDKSNWPAVSKCILDLVAQHRSTLIFANSRRLVEKLSGRLVDADDAPEILPHHGSISKEVRLETEEKLKRGELKAVVATSSLELGIDVGALDLVVQIDSPGNVAAGLQRVGRAGHLEKATAVGRLIPRQLLDLPQLAALIPLMIEGTVEETQVPLLCLDVLAQQIVASCARRSWQRIDLFHIFRRSYCYAGLSEQQFDAVIDMLSQREANALGGVRPQISFDRVNDQLHALPATAKLALINGGVISDTGQFAVIVAETNARIGELDEEFIFETKPGDRIILGSQSWMVREIENDRVIVTRAAGTGGRMPFWRGEAAPRSPLLGRKVGEFNRAFETRIAANGAGDESRQWLMREHHFDDAAADAITGLFELQHQHGGHVPTDRRMVVEHFRDKSGEPATAILCMLGVRVNHALRLALEGAFARHSLPAQFVHNDDGVLIRPADAERMPENPLLWLRSEDLEATIIEKLEGSALFGLRFRQAATRALMLPKVNPSKRTPLWQQRLRAKGLLSVVRQQRNFPIIIETYRECLQDVLLVDETRALLEQIEIGAIETAVSHRNEPSLFAHSLWMNFEATFLYQWDDPLPATQESALDQSVLDQVLGRGPGDTTTRGPIWTEADIATLNRRLSGMDYPARVPEELLEKLDVAGPLSLAGPHDPAWATWVVDRAPEMVTDLADANRIVWIDVVRGDRRVVPTEMLGVYIAALGVVPQLWRLDAGNSAQRVDPSNIPAALFQPTLSQTEAQQRLVETQLRRAALHHPDQLVAVLPFMQEEIAAILLQMRRDGRLVEHDGQVLLREFADQLRHIALRRERHAARTAPLADLQHHLLAWQHAINRRTGRDAVEDCLDVLAGLPLPLDVWENDVLPTRVDRFVPTWLDEIVDSGRWLAIGGADERIGFLPRHLANLREQFPAHEPSTIELQILDVLQTSGASFIDEIRSRVAGSESTIASALRTLFFHGRISNDRMESIRSINVEEKSNERVRPAPVMSRSWRSRWGARDMTVSGGRWFLLPAIITPASALDRAQQSADRVMRSLQRYGFLCRELNVLSVDGPWRQQYEVLSRMEWSGTVRRGYFVEGLSGSQFALPEVRLNEARDAQMIWLSALDPANIYSRVETRWQNGAGEPIRVPRMAGSWIALRAGRPILAAVSHGTRLIPLVDDVSLLEQAVQSVGELLNRLPRDQRHVLTVKQWGDADIVDSPAFAWLQRSGFSRDTQGLRLYRQYA